MSRTFFKTTCFSVSCFCFLALSTVRAEAQVQTLSSSGSQSVGNSGTSIGGANSGNRSTGASQSGLTTMGTFQNLNPQNAFIGRSDDAQNAFIGRSNAQNAANNAGQARNFNRTTGRATGQNQLRGSQGGPKVPEFRPQLRIAFTAPPLPITNVQTSMGSSFERIKERNEKLRGVQFEVNADRSVTLRGQVDSPGAKKLVEFLAMLEPGVRKVNNELTVAGSK